MALATRLLKAALVIAPLAIGLAALLAAFRTP
jgi:hypothetical protein